MHNSLSQGYQNLIVGDAKQSIYRWRGGEVEQFIHLPNFIFQGELLPNTNEISQSIKSAGEEKFLENNWRSDKEIVKFNNEFFSKLKDVVSEDLQKIYHSCEQYPRGQDGGYIHIDLTSKSPEFKQEVMKKIIDQILILKSKGYELKDMAILCRTGKETRQAAAALNLEGIDVLSDEALLINASKNVNFVLALLYFLNYPKDKIAIMQIITFLFRRDNEEIDIHSILRSIGQGDYSVFNSYISNLGIDFNPQKLWELPIYDLVERLINVFELSSSDIYLQYFLDVVHKFSIKHSNSIIAFLEWWEKNNHKEGIVVPEDMDAVKVMTVHKSKGLEFPIVFIPFNWKIGKPSKQFWVDTKGKLKKMKVALLNNNKHLEHSEYADIHKEEQQKALLDDINVLYVAMTRPKHQLYIYTEKHKDLKKINSLSKVVGHYFKDYKGDFPVKIGQLADKQYKQKEKNPALNLDYTSISNWRNVIQLKNNSNQLWDIQLDRQKWFGTNVYPKYTILEDKESVIDNLERNGLLSKDLKFKLKTRIEELLNDEQIKSFFSSEWEVKTEQEILQKGGNTYIPDRLLIKGNEVQVIDYKTGSTSQKKKHIDQIENYSKLLKMMGFKKVSKFIVYTEENEKIVSW